MKYKCFGKNERGGEGLKKNKEVVKERERERALLRQDRKRSTPN
jgi:hypothetical protein